MGIIINFFRSHSLPAISFEQIFEYFEKIDDCETIVNDDEVVFQIHDRLFDFNYTFHITKRSRINNIYNLSANYVNIKMYVDIPYVLPEYVSRIVLLFVNEFCSLFDLEVYHPAMKDITRFDMTTLIYHIAVERTKYINDHQDLDIFYIKRHKLQQVCNYTSLLPELTNKIDQRIVVVPYQIYEHVAINQPVLMMEWKTSQLMVFVAQLDYIRVVHERIPYVIPYEIFKKYIGSYLSELDLRLPDMKLSYMTKRSHAKAKNKIKKLLKYSVDKEVFEPLHLCQLVEI